MNKNIDQKLKRKFSKMENLLSELKGFHSYNDQLSSMIFFGGGGGLTLFKDCRQQIKIVIILVNVKPSNLNNMRKRGQ
jgi:hypothetical protein